MKFLFKSLLPLLMLLALPAAVRAQFTFTTNADATLTITKYTGSGGAVFIPSSTNGYPITGIGTNAFQNCATLRSVTITNGVSSIGNYAFASCSGLTNATLGGSVCSIGTNTFQSCFSLRSVTIPNSVTNIGDGGFSNSGLTNIIIGNRVTNVGKNAFNNCTSLASVTFPDSITHLSDEMFFNCYRLRHVLIPNSVTTIGVGVFDSCGLIDITVPDSVTSIGALAFGSCSDLKSITIPDSVTSLGVQAFFMCKGLTNVILGNGLTNIGYTTFAQCYNLARVTIGSNVTSIGESAFNECSSLTSLTFPSTVTNISNAAFGACTKLSGFYFLGNAPSLIGGNWFYEDNNPTVYYLPGATNWGATFGGCPTMLGTSEVPCTLTMNNGTLSITKYTGSGGAVVIPSPISGLPVTSIDGSAFQSCSNLTSVAIPASVINIGNLAFYRCTKLTAITVNAANPVYSSAGGILFDKSQSTLFQCPGSTAGSYTVPSTVTSIEDYAFAFCYSLTSIYFQSSAPSFGTGVFSNVSATVYYLPGTTGWANFSAITGLPAVLWNPQVQTNGTSFGVRTNRFGFNITGTTNIAVVVEACANLANPVWSSVSTNVLTNGSSYFIDPAWTNYTRRFYRLRSP